MPFAGAFENLRGGQSACWRKFKDGKDTSKACPTFPQQDAFQKLEEFLVVCLVRTILDILFPVIAIKRGKAGGMDPGRATEMIDLETRIIGEDKLAGKITGLRVCCPGARQPLD